jgi:ssDNA-binding Zn-finger/Zn-ribbon topoisomerase 1
MSDPILCGECGAPMALKRSSRFGLFYGCTRWPECAGTHGAHQKTGEPLGTPANRETKDARIRAHRAFDRLWKGGGMKRTEAYRWMQETLGLPARKAHISMFDEATCERIIEAINKRGAVHG